MKNIKKEMETKKIIYSGFTRFFTGLFGFLSIVGLLVEANSQLSRGEFRPSVILTTSFLSFVFLYATITGSAPFGLFEPKNKDKK